jgi:tetratricopeptide (TPR) repeat protein
MPPPRLLTKDRRWQEAEQVYRQSLQSRSGPKHQAQVFHSLGKMLVKIDNRRDEAYSIFEQSLSLYDAPIHQAQVLSTWATALSDLNEAESDDKAEEYALKGLELDPNNPWTSGILYHVLAIVYERRGDYRKAIEACEGWKKANQQRGDLKFVRSAQAKIDELSQKVKGQQKSKGKKKWWEE